MEPLLVTMRKGWEAWAEQFPQGLPDTAAFILGKTTYDQLTMEVNENLMKCGLPSAGKVTQVFGITVLVAGDDIPDDTIYLAVDAQRFARDLTEEGMTWEQTHT